MRIDTRAALAFWAVLAAAGCATAPITPGKVHGSITYVNTSPGVEAYLSSSPVVPNPGPSPQREPVHLYTPGSVVAAATSGYTPSNTVPAAQTYQAATYEIYPNVSSGGTDLLLTVEHVKFADNALYRFGSVVPASSYAKACNGITPVDTNPTGTQCDIAECAALLQLQLRFTGASADLAAIEDQPIASIPCKAQTFVEDVPGSGDFAYQADSSTRLFTLPDLISGNARIAFLVRGATSPVKIQVGCTVQIKPGESGFVVIPGQGTPLSAERTIGSTACGQTVAPSDIEIPVERHAGKLTGYLDVSGYDEVMAQVCVDNYYSYFCTAAPAVPATSTPTAKWEFEGIVAGSHSVMGRAVVNGGDGVLEFPQKAGANLPVQVVQGATTDMGATFVSRPIPARGELRLFDLAGLTDLSRFVAPPFAAYWGPTSFMQARGDAGLAPGPNGGSGYNATFKGRLSGTYDPAQNAAQLSYELLLNGLSDPAANLDGSGARPTPWDVDSFSLRMEPAAGGSQLVTVSPALDLHYIANLAALPPGGAFDVPEQRVCFGRETVEFRIDPSIGSISGPTLYSIYPSGLYNPGTVGTTPIAWVDAYSYGVPGAYEPSVQTASVSVTLPEGYQYGATPFLRFTPAGGGTSDATWMYLDRITIPTEGVLGCGTDHHPCIGVEDANGNFAQLSVSVTDSSGTQPPAVCTTSGDLDLRVQVDSDGVNVARVAYVLDPASPDVCRTGPAQELCATGCGPDPSFPISLTGLAAGQHTLQACAAGSGGCDASASYTFNVDVQPPSIQCAPDFTVVLTGGESSVPASDPRVAANLGAQVLGNCGLSAGITDDRPAEFPFGATPVTFAAAGIGSCTTNVKVIERVISFVTQDAAFGGEYVTHTRSFLDDGVDRIEHTNAQRYHFEYNDAGTHLAIIPNATGAVRIVDLATGAIVSVFAVPAGYTLYDVAFDPQDASRYAIVGTEAANPDQHAIFIYRGAVQLSRFDMPLFPATLRISRPSIAWAPDGSKISATFTQPSPAINGYGVLISEWSVVGDALVSPSSLVDARPNLQNREIVRELVYQDGDWRALGTHLTITLGIKRPGNEAIGPIYANENADLDLTPDGQAAALVKYEELLPIKLALPIFVAPLVATAPPTAVAGPVTYNVMHRPRIAISSDAQYLALGLDDKIIIYSVPSFTVVKEIPAVGAGNLEFRPF